MSHFIKESAEPVDGKIINRHLASDVVFSRYFDCSPEELWEFVENPDLLVKWFGGEMKEWELNANGGRFILEIAPQCHSTILEYEKYRTLSFTWDVPAWGHSPNLFGTTIKIDVRPDGNGAKMSFVHVVPYETLRAPLLAAAWHLHLDGLQDLVTGKTTQAYKIDTARLIDLTTRYSENDAETRLDYLKAMFH